MAQNSNLTEAKRNKNDEFYTLLSDIEKELVHYRNHFKGKKIFLNCDDPRESNFWRYFSLNFEFLGLEKLTSTHYNANHPTYRLDMYRDDSGELQTTQTDLEQNGDFRSPEAIEILKESDIVVTNPPFSLLREYISQLMEYKKDFLIVGNQNIVTYKDIFPLIKNNEMWIGHNTGGMTFKVPNTPEYSDKSGFFIEDGESYSKLGNICWYTNLDISKRHEELILWKEYNEEDYPFYDNYNAIEVSKVKDIPVDYDGVMGVPITFLDKYNPTQFEIVGSDFQIKNGLHSDLVKDGWDGKLDRAYIDGKRKYSRLLIKKKEETDGDRTESNQGE